MPEITALAKADRGRAAAARAEVALVEQEDGEARRQRRGDREHIRLLGRIAVEQHEGRRAGPGRQPRGELHAVAGGDRHLLDGQAEFVRAERDGDPRRAHGEPEAHEAQQHEAPDEDGRRDENLHGV